MIEDWGVDWIREHGYDGIIMIERGDRLTIAVFEPNQIKSATDNDGSYDKDDPSILSNPKRRSRNR